MEVVADDYAIPIMVDLCLYRVVSERCQGRVLPFGIRQLIKDFTFTSFTNVTLRTAVQQWCDNRVIAQALYGDINDWDVSRVTDMTGLFSHSSDFNDCIDRWDVRHVTNMQQIFYCACQDI